MNDLGIDTLIQRFRVLSRPMKPTPPSMPPLLHKLDGIRFVIFDFYGTLFVSAVGEISTDEAVTDRSIAASLKACGLIPDEEAERPLAAHARELYRNTMQRVGREMRELGYDPPEPDIRGVWLEVLNGLYDADLLMREPDSALARLFAVEYEARANPVWPMPDLSSLMGELHRRQLVTGIISNSQFYTPIAWQALTGESLRESGFHPGLLHWSFEEKRKKPDAAFYQGFLEKLERHFPGSDPESVLFVGNDMLKDITPAAGIGMRTALFAGDRRSLRLHEVDPYDPENRPDLILTRLEQLLECV